MDDEQGDVRPVWDYTQRVASHARDSPYGGREGSYGSYHGRHIIGRDSRIFGGIDFCVGHTDQMVVISHDDPDLPDLYGAMVEEIRRKEATKIEDVLRIVYDTVDSSLPHDYFGKRRLVREQSRGRTEVKLPLAMFVRFRVGVCREQALLAAYLLERLIDDKIIGGTVSADRSVQRLPWWEILLHMMAYRELDWRAGHEWARYTAPDGSVHIVDVAQRFCGRMWENSGRWGWVYARPNDVRPANVESATPPLFDPLDYTLIATGIAWLLWHAF